MTLLSNEFLGDILRRPLMSLLHRLTCPSSCARCVSVWETSAVLQVPSGLGAPVAANRGASGIDGVLSSAAGFAFGLNRGVSLVVGDISFLHDINGLSLLRSGEPPSSLLARLC